MWLKIMLVSIFGCSSVLSSCMAAVPLEKSLGVGELDTDGVCFKPGMACQNCTFAVTCISLLVGWLKIPLEQCPEGKTCNAHLQECSTETAPECDAETPKYHHTCEQIGIFPDVYDCHKFHLCSPPEGLPYGRPTLHREAYCPRNYGYDPDSGQCSNILENGKCAPISVPNCTKVGQTGELLSGLKHYYVCLSKHGNLYPQIFVCPNGRDNWECYKTFTYPVVETSEDTTE